MKNLKQWKKGFIKPVFLLMKFSLSSYYVKFTSHFSSKLLSMVNKILTSCILFLRELCKVKFGGGGGCS